MASVSPSILATPSPELSDDAHVLLGGAVFVPADLRFDLLQQVCHRSLDLKARCNVASLPKTLPS